MASPKPPPFEPEDIEIIRLPNQNCLDVFDCSLNDETDVNGFYKKDAFIYQIQNMGVTYIAKYRENIVGCITISMNSIKTKLLKDWMPMKEKFGLKHPPCVFIGQLGVKNEYQGRHVATMLCDYIYGLALSDFQGKIGCRYISLQCKKSKVNFYERMGFETTGGNADGDYFMIRKIVS